MYVFYYLGVLVCVYFRCIPVRSLNQSNHDDADANGFLEEMEGRGCMSMVIFGRSFSRYD